MTERVDSQSPGTLALTYLKQLAATPGQFEEVAQRYRMPPAYVRQGVTPIQQAIDLVKHAEACAQLDVLLNAIHAVAPHLTKLPSALKNPYLGLSAFRQPHAAQFFGRETEITALHEMVKQRAFVAVIGNSGSGKSSLVFAGLIPTLADWRIIECRPRDRFFFFLASALIDGLYQTDINQVARLVEISALEKLLATQPALLPDSLRRIQAQTPKPPRLLLAIDQFEELYTLNPPAVQHAALESLLALLDNALNACLLITLRADFLGQALNHPRLAHWLDAERHKLLGNLGETGLLEAITRPLQAQHLRFEGGLPQRIVHDLGDTPGQLPLLQFMLQKLWAERDGEVLTHARYAALGGVNQALAHHADGIYQSLSDEDKTALRRLFIQLIQPGEGTEDTRKIIALDQVTDAAQQALISRLSDENERLLVTGENTLEVAHEALIRHWTPLREWLKEDRPFRVWQEGLQRYLKDQVLLSGAALATAQEWLEKRGEEIRADERALIEQSAEKIARELAEKRRQQRRWTVFVLGFFVVALGLSGVAAWFWQASEENARVAKQNAETAAANAKESAENAKIAAQNEQRATQKAAEAAQNASEAQEKFTQSLINQSRMLSGYAEIALKEDKPSLAMRLTLEALPGSSETYPERPFVAVTYNWLSRGIHRQFQGVFEHEYNVNKAVFSPDGTRFLAASGTQALVWDMKTGQLLLTLRGHEKLFLTLRGHEKEVNSAAYSPDGTRIVTASRDKTARVWDAQTGQAILTLRGHEYTVNSAAYSPDGTRIVTASEDNTARVWYAQTGQAIRTLQGHTSLVMSAAYSPDGTRIVTASFDKTARVWDALTGQEIRTLRGHTSWVNSAAYSPDGTRIVTASRDKTARVWDARSGQAILTLRGHERDVNSAAYSPDGTRIVTASGGYGKDNTARVWDAETGQTIRTLSGHEAAVNSAVYSPDGTRIVTASEDNTARVWDAETGQAIRTLRGHESFVHSAAYSPDGTRIVTASGGDGEDNTARVWDALTGQEIRTLSGHEHYVNLAVYSPDGTRIVTAAWDKTARVWDAQTGQAIRTLLGHEDSVASAAYSPNGTRIVTASRDNTALVWDAQAGQEILTLSGHEHYVNSAAYSPDGTRIVTASGDLSGEDSTARVWDAKTGQAILTLLGHEKLVRSAAYSPDGRRIVTASRDNTARVWDVQTGEQLAILPHEDWVHSARFSPDGLQIVTASQDKTARIWLSFPSVSAMVEHAKKMLLPRISDEKGDAGIENFRLTCAERKQFFLEEVARCKK